MLKNKLWTTDNIISLTTLSGGQHNQEDTSLEQEDQVLSLWNVMESAHHFIVTVAGPWSRLTTYFGTTSLPSWFEVQLDELWV